MISLFNLGNSANTNSSWITWKKQELQKAHTVCEKELEDLKTRLGNFNKLFRSESKCRAIKTEWIAYMKSEIKNHMAKQTKKLEKLNARLTKKNWIKHIEKRPVVKSIEKEDTKYRNMKNKYTILESEIDCTQKQLIDCKNAYYNMKTKFEDAVKTIAELKKELTIARQTINNMVNNNLCISENIMSCKNKQDAQNLTISRMQAQAETTLMMLQSAQDDIAYLMRKNVESDKKIKDQNDQKANKEVKEQKEKVFQEMASKLIKNDYYHNTKNIISQIKNKKIIKTNIINDDSTWLDIQESDNSEEPDWIPIEK